MGLTYLPINSEAISQDSLLELVTWPDKARLNFDEVQFDAAVIANIEAATLPTTLADLPNANVFTSVFSVDVAAALGIPIFGSIDGKFSRRIYVQEYLRFKDDETTIPKKRYGIGIRWIVNVKILNTQAKINSLPFLSASAQVGNVEATALFQVIGIQSAKVTQAIPAPADLNVTTFVEMQQAFAKIIALVDAVDTRVTVQLLAIMAEVRDNSLLAYEAAIATGWALTKIDEGKSLAQAKNEWPNGTPSFDDAVKSVYIDITGNSDELNKPDNASRNKAHERLSGLRVRK